MLSERLSDPDLLRRVPAETVPYYVDTDRRADVAKRVVVEDLPSVVVFDPALGVLARHDNDYRNEPRSLVALLDALPERRREAEAERRAAAEAVERAPASGQARVALANVSFGRFLLDEADAEYARALSLLEAAGGEARNLRDDVEIARVYVRLLRSESADAIRLADEFLARRVESPFRWRALYYKGYALTDEDRLDEARAVLRQVEREPAAGEWRHAARETLTSLGE